MVADRGAPNNPIHGRHPSAASATMDAITGQICWFRRHSSPIIACSRTFKVNVQKRKIERHDGEVLSFQ
jgi:hypothetical protein